MNVVSKPAYFFLLHKERRQGDLHIGITANSHLLIIV
jgi:hypothetical protein